LLGLASTQLGVPVSSLSASNGSISGGGKTVTYGQLLGGKLFNVHMSSAYLLNPSQPPAPSQAQSVSTGTGWGRSIASKEVAQTPAFVAPPGPGLPAGAALTKPVSQYKLVGIASPPRVDIPAKVAGTYTYVHSIRVPGMLHGRIVRPR